MSSSSEAAETKCEKNKNSIDNTDTGTDATATATATANTSTATATAAFATAASTTTLTIDNEYDGCSSCARACGSGEEKNDNNNDNNNNNNNINDLTIARAMHIIESLTSLYGFSSEAANDAMNNIALKNGNNKESNNNNDSIDTIISLCCDYILDNGLGMDDGGAITPINTCPHVVQKIISDNDDDDDTKTNNMCCCVFITPNDIPTNIFDLSCQYYRDNNNSNNNNDNEKEKQKEKSTIVGTFKDDIEYDDDDNKEGSIATCPKGENWFCLYCGGIYCSRYVNGHGVNHYEDTNTNTNDNTTKSTNTTNIIDSSNCCVMVGLADLSIWCHQCESYLEIHNNTYLNSIINKLQQIKFD